MDDTIEINRAPVLTLWGAVVAERMGYDGDTALTLGRAVATLNAQAKGRRLGVFKPEEKPEGVARKPERYDEDFRVELCGREVPAKKTPGGVRAIIKNEIVDAEAARRYVEGKFGESLAAVREAMAELAQAFTPKELTQAAYRLYETFRPKVSSGQRGWGQKGKLDLKLIRSLARKTRPQPL
jgi:hypothetical protein